MELNTKISHSFKAGTVFRVMDLCDNTKSLVRDFDLFSLFISYFFTKPKRFPNYQ